jgi:hemolysin III
MSTVRYSSGEEIAHSVTHGVGAVASLAAIPLLVVTAALHGDAFRIVGGVAFGVTALMMFLTSTLYHAVQGPRAKTVLRTLDHSAIYLLIAGTYTPFTIGVMRGSMGWTLFGVVWALAVVGIAAKISGRLRIPMLSTALYVAIGWIGILGIKQLSASLTPEQLAWLLAGGALYTCGVPFYVWKRRPYAHAVWHLFVLAGVGCHFVAVLSLMRAHYS